MWLPEQSARSTRRLMGGRWAMHVCWHTRRAHRCSSLSRTSRIGRRNELCLQTARAQRASSHAHTISHWRTITMCVFGWAGCRITLPLPTPPALLCSLETPAWLLRLAQAATHMPSLSSFAVETSFLSDMEKCSQNLIAVCDTNAVSPTALCHFDRNENLILLCVESLT